MTLEAGLTGSFERTVETRHTAEALGSGDVAVLATPQVIAWCEEASCEAVADALNQSDTTVGMRVRVDHNRPTRVGATVHVAASLSKVEGTRLTFDVTASDGRGEIANGQIVRVVVDRARFMAKASGS